MGIQVVSFRCTLKNRLGQILSSTFNQDVLTHSSDPQATLKGLADGLRDLRKGERREIFLRADEAYGFYDPDKVISRSRDDLKGGERLRVGDQILLDSGTGSPIAHVVIEADRETVVLDSNHPLAGQDLVFEIEALEARDATPEEISEAETIPSHLH